MDSPVVLIFREMFLHRHKGGIVILKAVHDISDDFFRGDILLKQNQVLHLHGTLCQRTGFVQA